MHKIVKSVTECEVLSYDDGKGFGLDPCPTTIRRRFFDAYKFVLVYSIFHQRNLLITQGTDLHVLRFELCLRRDPEMWRVDLVICSHPAANCELYLPLNKSMLILATTRLEFGRNDQGSNMNIDL